MTITGTRDRRELGVERRRRRHLRQRESPSRSRTARSTQTWFRAATARGIYFNGVGATISQSTFAGNSASGGDGGGIYVNGNTLDHDQLHDHRQRRVRRRRHLHHRQYGELHRRDDRRQHRDERRRGHRGSLGAPVEWHDHREQHRHRRRQLRRRRHRRRHEPAVPGNDVRRVHPYGGSAAWPPRRQRRPHADHGARRSEARPSTPTRRAALRPRSISAASRGRRASPATSARSSPQGAPAADADHHSHARCSDSDADRQVPPPPPTSTPRPAGQFNTIPTLSWPALALLGLLLAASAAYLLRGQP